MHPRRLSFAVVVSALVFLIPMAPAGQGRPQVPANARVDALIQRAQSEGLVRVIVGVNAPFRSEGDLVAFAVPGQRAAIRTAQTQVLAAVQVTGAADVHSFETLPFISMRVGAASLAVLARTPGVASIEEDIELVPHLNQSTAIIGATTAAANGYTGAGWSVAVIDTGVQKSHGFLAGKVVSEACYSVNFNCPGGSSASTAVGSGEPIGSANNRSHGTHVAGIAAGSGSSFSGVARAANIVAINVFANVNSGSYTDVIKALERVLLIRATYNVAAVNMSLGSAGYSSTCDSAYPAMTTAINNLRSVGVATVISSGNDSSTYTVGFPACISTAISVGSTVSSYGTVDTVSSFSNSAPFLSLFAPGQWIYSSVINGYDYYQGTSMAAPHVAGAWAVMRASSPSSSVTSILSALQTTGTMITDSKAPSVTRPRINLYSAVRALVPPDPPTPCSFTISPSSASVAAAAGSGAVTLTSNKGGCGWNAGGSSASWLSIVPGYTSGTGSATVLYQFTANTSTAARSATVEVAGRVLTVTQAGAAPRGCCDGNSDGMADLYWRNQSNGQLATWFMNGVTLIDSLMMSPIQVADINWRIEAVMDIDADGDGDLIWRNGSTGDLAVWIMNGRTLVDSQSLVPGRVVDLNWRIVGSGDFNGDSKPDLLWRSETTGQLALWYMNGRTLIDSVYTSHYVADTNWRTVAVNDMDGDGDADLVLRHSGNGEMAVWFMNGRTLFDSQYLSVRYVSDLNWKVVGSGDFNRDGRPDLLWQNDATGDLAAWFMNGRTLIDSVALSPGRVADLNWKIIGPR